ncbi:hypothetical protein [Paraburkholderia kururiensis]|uniref:Uncharacterized protein n=1 Tax=Paraburkholderia kururiensis TaxID=984307 RepID=A0ABZ0WK88_9BURK|nr:hypothetical protein [Paraburkholderia kururiensis]WQD77774.1 hypothetical protein U0042_27680 [Paraburkholderia kururiensis]
MKRLVAMILFAAGGFTTEVAHPVYCSLLVQSRPRMERERKRQPDLDSANTDSRT